MFLHVLGGFYMFLHVLGKKVVARFLVFFFFEVTAGLDYYCSLVVQARHHELDMPGVPSRKKRKAQASEETFKRQLRRWPKVKNDSISMSSDTSS